MSIRCAGAKSVCILIAFWCSATYAEAASSSDKPAEVLTLSQALAAALHANPDLQATRFELTALKARATQAAARLNPELNLTVENFSGAGATNNFDALETTLSLSQVIELGDKRKLRVSIAEAAVDIEGIEQRARELDLLAKVAKQFVDVVVAQEHMALEHSASSLSSSMVNSLAQRVQAARSPQAELSRAQLAATRIKIDLQRAESELRIARRKLAALWGSDAPHFSAAQADLFATPRTLTLAQLLERSLESPDIVKFSNAARLRDAELQLARVQARPNLTVSLGLRRFEATGDTALVASVGLPLTIFDRRQGSIAESLARREQINAEDQAARARIRTTIEELYEQMLFSRSQLKELRDEAIPQAQAAFDQTRYGYDRGRFSYLELAAAQQELLTVRNSAIDAAGDVHRLAVEIERLTETSLTE